MGALFYQQVLVLCQLQQEVNCKLYLDFVNSTIGLFLDFIVVI